MCTCASDSVASRGQIIGEFGGWPIDYESDQAPIANRKLHPPPNLRITRRVVYILPKLRGHASTEEAKPRTIGTHYTTPGHIGVDCVRPDDATRHQPG